MRVLVVDDSKATRSIIKRMLAEGRDVTEADSAEEALVLLAEADPIDVILVDWHMPGMSGVDFIREVRRHAAYDAIRLLMVTSESDVRSVLEALQAGADEYIMKPFSKEGLLEKMELLGISDRHG